MRKFKNIVFVSLFFAFLFSMAAMCCFGEDQTYTESERRELAQKPKINLETLTSGEFMTSFDYYASDQFPFREKFRSAKAVFSMFVLNKMDNNGLFMADGHLSKIDEPQNEYMLDYAAGLFKKIIDKNVKDESTKVYFSIIPDKNYYLAEKNGYPDLDYDGFIRKMREKTGYMNYIDITGKLSVNDYYRTDTHWKQENIVDVAEYLGKAMGQDVRADYKVSRLNYPFKGVYLGQSALPLDADVIKYLTSDTLDNCTVTYYDTGKPEAGNLYNMEKAYGKDPYEMFLSGTTPLVVIENPQADTDRNLIIFRDSYGGSLAPLMVEGYRKVSVVDIRYVQSAFVGSFVDFANSDVLFIYSTTILNSSTAMK